MRALWDLHPALPYRATAPWPIIHRNGQPDWIDSVELVEVWLHEYIGSHYSRWTWTMWDLADPRLCSVSFAREPDSTLFLLRWS
jgi:hypothetical protein